MDDDKIEFFSDADFTSIMDAVDKAHPGDTVLMHPGIYAENIFVKKSLKIKA